MCKLNCSYGKVSHTLKYCFFTFLWLATLSTHRVSVIVGSTVFFFYYNSYQFLFTRGLEKCVKIFGVIIFEKINRKENHLWFASEAVRSRRSWLAWSVSLWSAFSRPPPRNLLSSLDLFFLLFLLILPISTSISP